MTLSDVNGQSEGLIEIDGIKKRFGTVEALSGVNLTVKKNEVLGLVGDNGAGKSTLLKTIVGLHQPDGGEILFNGEPMNVSGPREARELGISTVYQDLGLVDELSVAENMFLGQLLKKRAAGLLPVMDWETMESEANRILETRLNININPKSPTEYLSGGERQAVAIGRALVADPDVLFLDEPTSELSKASGDLVEKIVSELKETGHTILLIDHNLEEVISMCDRIAVMFDGRIVDVVSADAMTRDRIVAMMVSGDAESVNVGGSDAVESA